MTIPVPFGTGIPYSCNGSAFVCMNCGKEQPDILCLPIFFENAIKVVPFSQFGAL